MIKDTFANWRSVHKFYFLFNILTPLVSPSSPRKTTMWFLVLAPELFVCSTKLTWGRDYYIMLWQAAFNNVFTLKENSFFSNFHKDQQHFIQTQRVTLMVIGHYIYKYNWSIWCCLNPSFWQNILQSFWEMLTIAFFWLKALISGKICNFSWRLRACM